MNVFLGEKKPVKQETQRRLDSKDITPRTIKQSHLESNFFGIKFGLSTQRPDAPTENFVWFSTDTNTLSIWNGTAWVSQVFS